MASTRCILPWIHLHTWPNGNVYPCCLTPMEYKIGNLNKDTLSEIWNAPQLKTIRKQMINNEEPESCKRCFEHEKFGVTSYRQSANQDFKHLLHLIDSTHDDGTAEDFDLYYWDFRFSNVCNMRCRSCGPQLSTGWYSDTKKLWKLLPDNIPESRVQFNYWNEIEPFFEKVEKIYFAGGEPLIMEEHYQILEKLDNMQKYDVVIGYNTNFSNLQYKNINVLDMWAKFKTVDIGASIDGFGKQAEYIRKGTAWNEIENNRNQLKNRSLDLNFWINFTLSVYNCYHIIDFYNWAIDSNFIRPTQFRINLVQDPAHLKLQILPTHIKKDLTERYTKQAEKCRSIGDNIVCEQFYSTINYMNGEDQSHLLPQFKQYTQSIDKIRNESFLDVFPELEDLFNYKTADTLVKRKLL